MALPYLTPKAQRVVAVAAVLGVAFFAGTQYTGSVDESQFAKATHDALVASCEENGNPLREGMQLLLTSQNTQTERNLRTGVIAGLADTHAEAVRFRHLAKVGIWKRKQILKQIAPVPCAEQFPKP